MNIFDNSEKYSCQKLIFSKFDVSKTTKLFRKKKTNTKDLKKNYIFKLILKYSILLILNRNKYLKFYTMYHACGLCKEKS